TPITVLTAEPGQPPQPVPPPNDLPPGTPLPAVPRAATNAPASRGRGIGDATAKLETSQSETDRSTGESPAASGEREWSFPVAQSGDVTSREFIARALPGPSARPGGRGGGPAPGGPPTPAAPAPPPA